MKLTMLFLLAACLHVSASGHAQKVTIRLKNVTLDKVFREIKKQSGYLFLYKTEELRKIGRVTVEAENVDVSDAVAQALRTTRFGFRIIDRTIILEPRLAAPEPAPQPQEQRVVIEITGRITDEKGNPLSGASVTVKGSKRGGLTDDQGNFRVTANEKEVLVISYSGYESREIPVTAGMGRIDIRLKAVEQRQEEVVVIGYGTQKKVSVTGAISSIKPDDILKAPVSSVANTLAGRTTGIVSVQRGGEPGRDIADFYIRGIGTFAGGTSARPLVLVDGVERSLAGIDPYTIESFNVLKDASATAVFGVRGANGVIIITTKTGRSGKPQFSFSANSAWQNPIRLPKLLNAVDYATLRNVAEANDQGNPNAKKFSEYDIDRFAKGDDPYFHPNVDWFNYLLRNSAPQQLYNLNISGGGSDSKYFVSLGYLNQTGIYKLGDFFKDVAANPSYKRYNIRTNFDFNVNEKFTVAIKAASEISNSNYSNSTTSDFFGTILSANPVMSPVLYDGKIVRNVEGLTAFQISNTPLYQLLQNGYNENFSSRLTTNLSARYKLDAVTRGLALRGMVAFDAYYLQAVRRAKQIPLWDLRRNRNAGNFQDSIVPVPVINQYEGPVSFGGESFSKNRKVYGEAALEYSRSFGGHAVTGLLLGTMERFYDGGNQLPFNYMGLVARATYNYRNKYFVDLNMGYNGSENFAVGKQFGFFPSFSMGYAISEEKFFPRSRAVSYLKLRGSYGLVGNDKIGGNRFLFLPSSFALGGTYYLGLNHTPVTGYRESSLGNPNVTWEQAKKLNIGADFRLLADKITFSADYFTEKRDKILWNLNVPITFGSPSLISPYNFGQAENRGYEFEAGYNSRRTSENVFNYRVNLNYSFARNKIIYFDESPQPYPGLAQTGSRIGQPKGLIADGFFTTMDEINDPNRPRSIWEGNTLRPGDIRYVDVNGDGRIDDNDRVNIGNPNIPEIVYGATFGVSYKGAELTIFFQGADNVSTYLQGESAWPFIAGTKTAFENAKESWSPERYAAGDRITLPRLTASPDANKHNYRVSSFWMQDAAYLRLKNVELGYNITGKSLARAGIRGLRVYVSGQNLITWTQMRYFDPEIPSSNGAVYPMTRVLNAGINLQF